jgi:ABC-2 type transport system ATP-binding protein
VAAAPAIETFGLSKTYGGRVRALSGLDLRVEGGEVFGFLGPNGAGKSTSIRLLLDLIRPTSGRASLMGLDSRRASVEARRHVGYLPGDLRLANRLTGREQLESLARLRGAETPLRDALCERFGAVLDRPIRELSKGNRQKLGLVQAFMHRPRSC